MRRFLARFASLFRGRRAEGEMAREIASHLALLQEDFERRGLSPQEAALAARRAYGGVELAKELHREVRSFVWIEQLYKDVGYAWRNLLRNPGFTVLAAVALALGIGANATIFGIYNAVALKQLPVADTGRVVRVKRGTRYFSVNTFAYPEYEYLRDHNGVFAGVTASSTAIPVLASIAGRGAPEHVNGYAVSANYFADLGVPASLGRTFLPDEDLALGANTVAVLSYRFWLRRYDGDPNVVGQTIKLNGMAYTIVGVAPREFTGTAVFPVETSLWVPLSMIGQLNPAFGPGWCVEWRDSTNHGLGFELLARLKKGVSRTKAQAETDQLIRTFLAGHRETFSTIGVTLQRTSWSGEADNPWFQAFAAAVLTIVSLVLLVACANVANMLLARGVARHREIAIRLALGGSRARVIRQLLTESILLSLLGGAAGIVLSVWASRLVWTSLISIAQNFRSFQADLDLSPDAHILLYGLALSVLTGIVFGLAPALQSTRADLHTAIHQEGLPLGRRLGRSRLRGLLLGAQVAVSVLLLVVSGGLMSGLMVSFVKSSDLGFETRDTWRLNVYSPKGAMETLGRIRARLEARPELSRVAIGGAPLVEVLNFQMEAGKWEGQTPASFASDGYFEALDIRLLRGRGFTRQESDGGAPVAVVSQSTAGRVWPNEDPIGRHFTVPGAPLKVKDYEVVGVVTDTRFVAISQIDPLHVYLPNGALPRMLGGVVFRIRGDRGKALEAVESAVESVDPSLLPGMILFSFEAGPVAVQRGFFRVLAVFAGVLTLLSLTLAGVGIYGVMAFLVSQRTREIGIRMAMGATSGEVLRSVVIQGLRPVLVGTLVGLAMAIRVVTLARADGFAKALNLFSRASFDPALFGALSLMLAIAVLASAIPARRAASVDPVVALRHE